MQVNATKFPSEHGLETRGTDRSITGTIRSYIIFSRLLREVPDFIVWVMNFNFTPSDVKCSNCGRIKKAAGITEEIKRVLEMGTILGALRNRKYGKKNLNLGCGKNMLKVTVLQ